MFNNRFAGMVVLVAGAICLTGWASADDQLQPAAPGDPLTEQARADVYLDDSFEATDAIAQARRFAGRGQWRQAAELLQRTCDTAGDKLIRVEQGYYVGLRARVHDLITGWPAVGIAAYRTAYEHDIKEALAATGPTRPVEELLLIFERYFSTATAAQLADTIGQIAIEDGDFALARRVYSRVLDQHPDRKRYESDYGVMLALLAVMQGDQPDADYPYDGDRTLRWMGHDRPAAEILEEIKADFANRAAGFSPRGESARAEARGSLEWPTFGGDVGRNRPGATNVDELGLLWRFDGFGAADAGKSGLSETTRLISDPKRYLTINPVTSGELVFAQSFREIVALNRHSGETVWRIGGEEASIALDEWDAPGPSWHTVTVHRGRLYACLPTMDISYYGYETPAAARVLVCLDAGTGREIWRTGPASPTGDAEEISFDSAPLVVGGRLYVVGRRQRSFGFEDCYLYCLNSGDGSRRFRTHIGSASTGTFASRQATLAIPAIGGDTVYVCTNLGTVAAVSAHSGAVRWLRLYERSRTSDLRQSGRSLRQTYPWQYNPVLCTPRRIVCLPTDARQVLVLARDDGRLERAIPVAFLAEAETLLGVHGHLLCCAGTEVTCFDLEAGERRWSVPLPADTELAGRGVWADDRLLIPTQTGLGIYQVEDGRRTFLPWDAGESGGNLLALPDQLLVASDKVISVYVRKREIWSRLERQMSASPTDPAPALELAEVALRGGDLAEALKALDEAVERAGAFVEPLEPAMKRRLFDGVLLFVDTLAKRAALDQQTLDKLFVYAAQCPPAPADHVLYRRRFAELFEARNAPDRALGIYQQLLRDRGLRELPIEPDDDTASTAGAFAEKRIAHLIAAYGRSLYEPFEQQARRLLQRATFAADQAMLSRVIETFPNSYAAPAALLAQAGLLGKSGNHVAAAKRLTTAYHRYHGEVDQPDLMRRIAIEYERAGMPKQAYRWLTKAAHEHPTVTFDYQGRAVTFLDYRKRLAAVRKEVEPSRPRITLPLARHTTHSFDDSAALLTPRFGSDPRARHAIAFVYTQDGIQAFDPSLGRRRWDQPAGVRAKPQLLITTDRVAIFATMHEVFGLSVEAGTRVWSIGSYPPLLDDSLADWEQISTYRTHALHDGRLVSVRDDGHMTCVAIDDGTIVWERTHRPLPLGTVRLSDAHLVYYSARNGYPVLCVVSAADGTWIGSITADKPQAVEDLFIALDGQAVLLTSQSLLAYDLETLRRRWSVTPGGHLQGASVRLDIDAVYLTRGGSRVEKISLQDGATLWQAEKLARYRQDDLTLNAQAGYLLASSERMVVGLDAATGSTLWKGRPPAEPYLVRRIVTEAYLLAVNVPPADFQVDSHAYFYDYRHASGMIPRQGGTCNLGRLSDTDLRAILALDNALLIQTGSTIHAYATR